MSYQLARIDSEYNSLFPAGAAADAAPSVAQHRAQYQAWNQEVVGASQVAARQQTALSTLDSQATQTQAVLKQSQGRERRGRAAAAHRADDRHHQLRAPGPQPDARDDRARPDRHGRADASEQQLSLGKSDDARAGIHGQGPAQRRPEHASLSRGEIAMQFNTLTLTLQNFITALSGGYSRIQGSASTLLGILVGIEVVLLGLWTALGGGDNVVGVFKRILHIGAWVWIVQSYPTLCEGPSSTRS